MEGPLRILGETAYPPNAASARVRLAAYEPWLAPAGISLNYRPTLTNAEYALLSSTAAPVRKAAVLARSALRAALTRVPHDLLLVHRLRLLGPLPGLDPPLHLDVYDLDDALFLGFAAPANRSFQWAKQEARRCVQCIRRARLTIAGNTFLADRAREYSTRVEVVPSCVDPASQPVHQHGPADVVRIGWIGSHTTSSYLREALGAIERLNEPRLRARLIVVGGDPGRCADWIEQRPWSLARQPEDLAEFDIGIMPVPDTEWARGKCGYKILQYFSAGVPAVASPVGVNSELIGRDRGLLAATPDEWYRALGQLLDDADERRERGARARAFVEASYSYQRWAPEVASLLRSL